VSRIVPASILNYVAGMYRVSAKSSGSIPLLTLTPTEALMQGSEAKLDCNGSSAN
jgi:hypothetical protein